MTESEQRILGRMEGKQDATLDILRDVTKRLNVHSERLQKLETWRTRLTAYALVISIVIGALFKIVIH